MSAPTPTAEVDPAFAHQLVLHDGVDDFAEQLAPTARDAVDHGDAVLVCVAEDAWGALAARLGERAERVTYVPAGNRYARPAVAMAMLHRFVTDAVADGAPSAWSIGTIPFDGRHDEEWARYESAVDVVLGHLPVRAVCTYDVGTTAPALLDVAHRCHHEVVDDRGGGRASDRYVRAAHVSVPPIAAPSGAPAARRRVPDSAAARECVRTAVGDRMPAAVLDDVLLATSELVTNALRHGRPPVITTVWVEPTRVVVDVHESGPGVADPFFELRPPVRHRAGGAGLWLVGQVTDAVRLRREADGSSSVVVERCVTDTTSGA